jgi:hypothetical protein
LHNLTEEKSPEKSEVSKELYGGIIKLIQTED